MSSRRLRILLPGVAALAFALGYTIGKPSGFKELESPIAEAGPTLERSLSMPHGPERARRLVSHFERLGVADVASVQLAYEQARPFVDPMATLLLADWWARQDPLGAFEATRQWPLNDLDLGFSSVLRAWAQREPLAALQAFGGIGDPDRYGAAILALTRGLVDAGDLDGASTFLEHLPDGGERQRAIGYLASALIAREDMDALEAFAEALPEDAANRYKSRVYRRVATALTLADPQRGARWAERHMDGPHGDTLARRVAVSWVRLDPEAMLAWLVTLPEGRARDVAVREGYRQWLVLDRGRALEWLEGVELTPELGSAAELYAISVGRDDPARALDWAARIEANELRERATVVVARRWLYGDPEAARAWLDAAELPDAWRERIERESKSPGPAPSRGGAARAPARSES